MVCKKCTNGIVVGEPVGNGNHVHWLCSNCNGTGKVSTKPWKRLGASAYEYAGVAFDFHARKENDKWMLDIFILNNGDSKYAYVRTETFDSLKAAKEYAKELDCSPE